MRVGPFPILSDTRCVAIRACGACRRLASVCDHVIRYVDWLRTALVEPNSIDAGTQAGLRPTRAALSASENEYGRMEAGGKSAKPPVLLSFAVCLAQSMPA